jgi:hypothetical protein
MKFLNQNNRSTCVCTGLLAAVFIGLGVLPARAQNLYVHYDFNVPPNENDGSAIRDISGSGWGGIFEDRSGALNLGRTPGVSGKAGDFALPGGFEAPASWVNMSDVPASFPGEPFQSNTISFWFKGDLGGDGNAGRIFEYVRWDGQFSTLFVNETPDGGEGVLHAKLGVGPTIQSSADVYTETDEWVFVALTYDAQQGEATFWKGTKNKPVEKVNTVGNDSYTWAPGAAGGMRRCDFANRSNLDRRQSAVLDDFRIYGSTIDESGALTQKQLDEIRLEAVNKTSKN